MIELAEPMNAPNAMDRIMSDHRRTCWLLFLKSVMQFDRAAPPPRGSGLPRWCGRRGLGSGTTRELDPIHAAVIDNSSPVFVGAAEHTSGTGELTALIEAIWWLLEEDPTPTSSVLLRPDSEYTMGAATGDISPEKNVDMVRELRKLYGRLRLQRKGKVTWSHVRSHTDHIWNDRVDDLAEVGAKLQQWNSRVPGGRWRKVRLDSHLVPHRPLVAIRGQAVYTFRRIDGGLIVTIGIEAHGSTVVRIPAGEVPDMVKHLMPLQVDEPARILRARNVWGILNLFPSIMEDEDVRMARDKRLNLIDALTNDTCSVSERDQQRARVLVISAAASLSSPARREQETRKALENPIRPTTRLQCPVDMDALDEYINHPDSNVCKNGSQSGVTHRALATLLRDRAAPFLSPEPGADDTAPPIGYAGIIPIDGHGFWLRRIQYGGKWVWSDIGDVFSGRYDDAWEAAVSTLGTAMEPALARQSEGTTRGWRS